MKDSDSAHKKVQEMCDCFATTDPLKEMSTLKNDSDIQAAATKWVALTALHGVNSNAEKISIQRSGDGTISVVAKYRKAELPSPGQNVGQKIFETVRQMTYIEADKGKTALALGIRDSSVDLDVKVKKENGSERIIFHFPEK